MLEKLNSLQVNIKIMEADVKIVRRIEEKKA